MKRSVVETSGITGSISPGARLWDNFTITREDIRHAYGEKRLVTFGILKGDAVVMVYTERRADSHIISLRKAEKHEARYYFKVAKDYFK